MTDPLRGVALRLHGPMQAWGGATIGDNRPTLSFPTRSGVLGLIAACLGITRSDRPRLLALADSTRVHIRVDAAGTPLVDDQTIQGKPNASTTRQTIQSKRTYLCDASFVAIIVPGPSYSTTAIAKALTEPVFAPFLGRRSCSPSTPLLLQEDVTAETVLALFYGIPRGPLDLLDALRDRRSAGVSKHIDFYLDIDTYPGTLRRIAIRDHFVGPLLRQYRERFACHVQETDSRQG
jgi:CRISPR system Cascade subunit CasD